MFKDVCNKINILKETSSKKQKEVLLKEYMQDEFFKKVVYFTLNPAYNFKISKLLSVGFTADDEDVFKILLKFNKKAGITKEDKLYLSAVCINDTYCWEVVERILKRNLGCGVDYKLINKVCPGFIPITPYQRCSGKEKIHNIKYPAYVQPKLDGAFAYLIKEGKKHRFISRSGEDWNLQLDIGDIADGVYAGELVVLDHLLTAYLPRKIGNGILNRDSRTPEEIERIRFVTWLHLDKYAFESGSDQWPYCDVLDSLRSFCRDSPVVEVIQTLTVHNEEMAVAYAKLQMSKGGEGAVLKNKDVKWKDGKSTAIIKLKEERTAELRVVGVIPGTGKYEGLVGSLSCVSECGTIAVDVGSGFTDEERQQPFDFYLDKIVTVKYNAVIKSGDTSKPHSLFLPIFIEVRNDKTRADTF